jgi:hypothetical protein
MKMQNEILKMLRYFCLLCVIVFGLMAIVGTGGGGGEDDNTTPIANISSPLNDSTYNEGDTITFSGTGSDEEDGTLTGSSLVWTSSLDGEIGTGTSFTRNDLSAGIHDAITLTATDSNTAAGTDSIGITVNTITTAPSTPTNVAATAGNEQVTISWDSVTDATSYNIYWSISSGVTIDTGTEISGITTTSYTHSGRTNGTTYYYVVTAENDYGESDESDQDSATPSGTDSKLPDTGQTQSYTTTFGEDSDYTIDPPSYTDNSDGTITDNVTGLIWQKEDDDITRNWDDAVTCCNDLTLASYTDWRLPSEYELMSIVNCNTYGPSINTFYFSGTNESYYWSSTTSAGNSSSAWFVDFDYGYVDFSTKSFPGYVRCVRGQELSFGNFTDNDNGTVTDNNTGLIWQQGEGGKKTWEDAITYCEDLSLAGYTDWRLPNKNELNSIIDYEIYDPAIDTNFFSNVYASYYWSSTTYVSSSSSAWGVYFYDGYVDGGDKSGSNYVRCVRAGQ